MPKYARFLPNIVAGFFISVGILMFISEIRYKILGKCAKARVLELIERKNKGISYAPKFEFQAENGRIYKVVSDSSGNPPHYQIGEIVTVYYFPENPGVAIIDDGTNFLFGPCIFILFGFLGKFAVLSAFQKMRNVS